MSIIFSIRQLRFTLTCRYYFKPNLSEIKPNYLLTAGALRPSYLDCPNNHSYTARVDFKKPHPPLLLIAGSADHIIPALLNKSNVARYKPSPSVTDFKEFAGRTHFIIGQKNWEEVADYVLAWLNEKGV